MNKPLLEYAISARRIDGHEGEALCIDIDPAGRRVQSRTRPRPRCRCHEAVTDPT